MPTLESNPPAYDVTQQQPLEQLLQQAIKSHQAGNLPQAEKLYRLILSQQPGHADANHNLGILAVGTGHPAAALPYFQAAIQANPSHGQFWLSCIDALIRASQIEEARQALNLGVQCGLRGPAVEALHGRLQDDSSKAPSAPSGALSEAVAEAKVPAEPARIRAQDENGRRRKAKPPKNRQGKMSSGRSAPNAPETSRLEALFGRGSDEEIEALAHRYIARYPKSGYAWNILGALRQRNSRFSEAESFFRGALQAEPDFVDAWFNLGVMLKIRGDLTEAEASIRRAIALRAGFLEAHYGLGEICYQGGNFAEAEVCYRTTIEIQPDLAVAHNNLAIVLRILNRPGESEASCRRALELNPRLAETWCSLGAALQDQGQLGEAAASYRRAVEIQPGLPVANHGLLFCLSHGGETDPEALFQEHLRFAQRFEVPLRAAWPQHPNSRDPDRQLRIGFVSGDFRNHALAYFIEPIFSHLANDAGLSLHAYSNHAGEDAVTRRLRGHSVHWNEVFALSDEMLAAKIQSDAIDILVDLTGHTARTRLLSFARKPAPLQCGWIGYLGTSGLESIDYYLADRHFLPPGEFDRYFTEKIVYLPAVAPFQPGRDAPEVNPLPALTTGHLTFGSFCRISKLSPRVIALWSQLLRALPESRMIIGGMPRDGRHEVVSGWFKDEGIMPERLQFHPRSDSRSYFALHHRIDLCLDPFPFTGGTTTAHALWMGVPTLTLTGQAITGRLGPAILAHVGLDDFVARTPQVFIDKGIYWSRSLESLAQLRAGMRELLLQSPIGQPALVASGLAATFREMWRDWCARSPQPPR
ncbi:MAG: tetratricopeptide repeat protein [Acidobacteriaceae bacterium]|jgi:predicted O-linked N-acetylglucosamine transferase (SPINDLY family)